MVITEVKTEYETDLDHRGRPTGVWKKDYSVIPSENSYPDIYDLFPEKKVHYRNIKKFSRTVTYGEWEPLKSGNKECACPSEAYVTLGVICPICGGSRPW